MLALSLTQAVNRCVEKMTKKFFSTAVIVGVALLIVVLAVLRFVGFEPSGRRAGLWLPGTPVTTPVNDWAFTDPVQEIHIQTHTWYLVPHSVTIQCVNVGGQLYVASFHFGGSQAP